MSDVDEPGLELALLYFSILINSQGLLCNIEKGK